MPRLAIDLVLQVAQLQRDMNKVVSTVDKGFRDIRNAANSVRNILGVLGISYGAYELVSFIKAQIELQDRLVDLSTRLNITVTDLAGFKYAAEAGGTSLETFTTGVRNLNKYLSEAANNPGNRGILRALNVDTNDPTKAIYQLADAFRDLGDTPARTEVSLRLFGKAGDELIPVLAQGSEELRKQVERGKEFSRITDESAKAAKALKDNITDLKAASAGAATEIGNRLVPELTRLTGEFAEGIKLAGGFFKAIETFGTINPFRTDAENLKLIREEIELIDKGEQASTEEYRDKLELQKRFLEYKQREAALALGKGFENYKGGRETGAGATAEIGEGADGAKASVEGLNFALAESSGFIINLRREASKITDVRDEFDLLIDEANRLGPAYAQIAIPLVAVLRAHKEMLIVSKAATEEADRQLKAEEQVAEIIAKAISERVDYAQAIEFQTSLLGKSADEQERLVEYRRIDLDVLKQLEAIADQPYEDQVDAIAQIYAEGEEAKKVIGELIDKFKELSRSADVGIADALNRIVAQAQNSAELMDHAITNAAQSMEDAIVKFAQTGKFEFRELVSSIIADLLRLQIKQSILGPLAQIFLGQGTAAYELLGWSSADLAGLPPGLASGGPVSAGSTYIVGEKGPELFVPNMSGTIVPNDSIGSGGPTMYVDARGADRAEFERLKQFVVALNGSIEERSVTANMTARRKGGAFASTFGA